jgi:hypothetical protein
MQDNDKTTTTSQSMSRDEPTVTITYRHFCELLKIAGQQIDPATAEVEWSYALTLDPYGVWENMPEEYRQVGREYFVRAPESSVWVSFHDLPKVTRDALWNKYSSKLAFPAGLEELFEGHGKQG